MSAFRALLRRDIRRTRRAPTATILLLLFPVAIGAIFSLAFGGSETPRIRLLLAIQDEGLLGRFLAGSVEQPQFRERIDAKLVDAEEGRRLLDRGEASALVVFPAGFTDRVLDGDSTTISVTKNARESILPQVVEEGALLVADGLASASLAFSEPLAEIRELTRGDGGPDPAEVAGVASALTGRLNQAGRFLFPPVVQLRTVDETGAQDTSAGAVFLFILPGFVVMTLVMIADFAMRDLLRDAARGTLRLTLTSPTTIGTVVHAKIAFTVLLGLVSLAILTAFGAPFVDAPVDLAAYVALSLTYCLAAGGFAALTYGLARNERQGAVVGSIVLLVMSFLGGSYIPLASLPPGMRALSPFTLNYWGVDGYRKILAESAGVAGVGANIAVLLVLFGVFASAGGALLSRRLARGAR